MGILQQKVVQREEQSRLPGPLAEVCKASQKPPTSMCVHARAHTHTHTRTRTHLKNIRPLYVMKR